MGSAVQSRRVVCWEEEEEEESANIGMAKTFLSGFL